MVYSHRDHKVLCLLQNLTFLSPTKKDMFVSLWPWTMCGAIYGSFALMTLIFPGVDTWLGFLQSIIRLKMSNSLDYRAGRCEGRLGGGGEDFLGTTWKRMIREKVYKIVFLTLCYRHLHHLVFIQMHMLLLTLTNFYA